LLLLRGLFLLPPHLIKERSRDNSNRREQRDKPRDLLVLQEKPNPTGNNRETENEREDLPAREQLALNWPSHFILLMAMQLLLFRHLDYAISKASRNVLVFSQCFGRWQWPRKRGGLLMDGQLLNTRMLHLLHWLLIPESAPAFFCHVQGETRLLDSAQLKLRLWGTEFDRRVSGGRHPAHHVTEIIPYCSKISTDCLQLTAFGRRQQRANSEDMAHA